MSKTMKQLALHRSGRNKGPVLPGKFAAQEAYGFFPAPVNSHIKELLAKARQTPTTRYMVVQINQELTRHAEQKPVAKVEVSKAMFAKYRSAK